jgi:hypothetical protein
VSQAATPVSAMADRAITLTSATAGAAIWFTVDDSPPVDPARLAGSTATLYGGPIPITQAGNFYLRAMAVLDGLLPSQVNRPLIEVS